ncbi:MAG: hypothetical protein IT289_12155 [Oligoflexia bacterium]|nr:hypothetical protein [Oligoflexia bacterium]
MKTSIKLAFGTMALMGLVACDDIKGGLDVNAPLPLTTEKGVNLRLEPSSYPAQIKLNDDKRLIEFKIKRGDETVKLKVKVPYSTDLDGRSAKFDIKSVQSGQPFDLVGELYTNYSTSGKYYETESCTYGEHYRECSTYNGRTHCRDVSIARNGRRHVTYHYLYRVTKVSAQFLGAADQETLAVFTAEKDTTSRIVDHYGSCRRY